MRSSQDGDTFVAGVPFQNGIAPAPVIECSGVNFCFGQGELRKQILFDVELAIQPGEVVLLTGPSGSGKTTLLTLIAGLRTMQEGQMRVLGYELHNAKQQDLLEVRRRIGFIFQAHNLLPYLTALHNVQVMFDLHPEVSSEEGRDRAAQMLEQVGLGDRMHYHVSRLSGGQRQRVAIARALVGGPQLVLADEPTAALDGTSGREVVNILQELAREQGRPILMVTHDARVLDIADRIIDMQDGRLSHDSSVAHAGPTAASH
ncbi:MAG: ATP-binding cassette domain-containing protein [Planctomycetota bacterium]